MWILARNYLPVFLLNAGLLLTLLCLHWFAVRKNLDAMMIMFQAQLLIYMIMASLVGTEQREAKTRGRAFLHTLPVHTEEIIGAKFMTVLLAVAGIAAVELLMYEFIGGPPQLFRLGRILILISAVGALILSGLVYVFLYRFGISKTIKIGWVAALGVMVIPFVLAEWLKFGLKRDFSGPVAVLSAVGWPAVAGILIVGAMLYLGLERWAVKAEMESRG